VQIGSINAASLRFSQDGLPDSFIEAPEDFENFLGGIEDLRAALLEKGCTKDQISDAWLVNQKRWIIWKLASIERRFASVFGGGGLLTYEHLVGQLYNRYCKEYRDGKRPALRKILNKDAAASRMMILCVSQIFTHSRGNSTSSSNGKSESNTNTTNHSDPLYSMELSDGWYSIHAVPDERLCAYIRKGKIAVGAKLLLSSAILVGAEEGIDPLDEMHTPQLNTCKVFLKISANCSRLAKWNAPLGFVSPAQQVQNDNGLLRVRRVSDIVPAGGSIALIHLTVCRRYPVMFHHRQKTGEDETITESEECKQRADFERRKLRSIEKFTEEVEDECMQVSSPLVLPSTSPYACCPYIV
jgi:breast cancer 2 susceptibility protein